MERISKFFKELENIKQPQLWDNTGILIDCNNYTSKYLLTIDITNEVLDECITKNILNIISYHPFIFHPLKTIPEIYIKTIANKISVFSIHTCLDYAMCLNLANIFDLTVLTSFDTFIVTKGNDIDFKSYLKQCKELIKQPGIRYVLSNGKNLDSKFDSVIIGVGAAQKEFMNHANNSLIITGEMSHHDMLYYRDSGNCVILMEHSNSERIHVPFLYEKLCDAGFDVTISKCDADPVNIYQEH